MHVHVHADTGLEHIDDHEAQHQGERGHHFKVEERLDRHAANFLEVVDARDAAAYGAKNDRTDQHLDDADKGVAHGLQIDAELRKEVTRGDT